ncbi:MAG: iron-sulfur cluster insertion protein ErpA [Anaerolineae bacterium]|nr:iron-sulfur cluster insertion protein ErpA [Thermoflexus sp.]MDW8064598.1 iron-sulfur cluster insertion protein ErpA [Anaerolineae bacterium]
MAEKIVQEERGQVVALTEGAARKLHQIMREKQMEGYFLRVFVAGGGCAGLQYGMGFESQPEAEDHQIESYGIRILVDPISATYLWGSTIDYVDALMGGGFQIHNPNAVATCGCGHSFRTQGGAASSGGGCGCH